MSSSRMDHGRAAAADAEQRRILARDAGEAAWGAWGPYLSERQWGTVREDYSVDGSAWDYLSHDMARSVAYRWGEDGIAGFSDDQQRLCLSLAMWNGKDRILKERMFGLTNREANHGEDVKELYYYLDATPTHSYLKMLYKYPHAEFPYADLVTQNGRRGYDQPEYELLDTGVFDRDRYCDVFIEYAKSDVDDIVMRVTAVNRGAEAAELTIIPQLCFRNTWSWEQQAVRPIMSLDDDGMIEIRHPGMRTMHVQFVPGTEVLFTENDTNPQRRWGGSGRWPPVQGCLPCLPRRWPWRRDQPRASGNQAWIGASAARRTGRLWTGPYPPVACPVGERPERCRCHRRCPDPRGRCVLRGAPVGH